MNLLTLVEGPELQILESRNQDCSSVVYYKEGGNSSWIILAGKRTLSGFTSSEAGAKSSEGDPWGWECLA